MSLLPKDPGKRNAVLMAVLVLSSAYLLHSYVYTPIRENTDALQVRLGKLEDQNRRAEAAADRGGAELERRLTTYEAHVAQLEKLIPASEEVAALLEAISLEERRAGVEVTVMRPDLVEEGEFYDRWSYELGVRGGYHAVGSFMTAIASLERIVAPEGVIIVSANSGGGTGGDVLANFRIRTYVSTPPERDAPSVSQGGGSRP